MNHHILPKIICFTHLHGSYLNILQIYCEVKYLIPSLNQKRVLSDLKEPDKRDPICHHNWLIQILLLHAKLTQIVVSLASNRKSKMYPIPIQSSLLLLHIEFLLFIQEFHRRLIFYSQMIFSPYILQTHISCHLSE